MPRFTELDGPFVCPHRQGCLYLEGLSAQWVWRRYQEAAGLECEYERQLGQLHQQLEAARGRIKALERENQEIKAQLHALHRRQFKGRAVPPAPAPGRPGAPAKKRGAPPGHPPWQRPKPRRIDRVVDVPAPENCPQCQGADLQPVRERRAHVQEDIVLEPRTVTTCFVHQQAYCPQSRGARYRLNYYPFHCGLRPKTPGRWTKFAVKVTFPLIGWSPCASGKACRKCARHCPRDPRGSRTSIPFPPRF